MAPSRSNPAYEAVGVGTCRFVNRYQSTNKARSGHRDTTGFCRSIASTSAMTKLSGADWAIHQQ